jgi:hypothetical protein
MTKKQEPHSGNVTSAPGREDACDPSKEPDGVSRRVFLREAASAAGLVGLGLLAPGSRRAAAADGPGAAAPPGEGPEGSSGGQASTGSSQPGPAEGQAAGSRLLVGYCGIYCGLCSTRGRIPERAASLLAAMRR